MTFPYSSLIQIRHQGNGENHSHPVQARKLISTESGKHISTGQYHCSLPLWGASCGASCGSALSWRHATQPLSLLVLALSMPLSICDSQIQLSRHHESWEEGRLEFKLILARLNSAHFPLSTTPPVPPLCSTNVCFTGCNKIANTSSFYFLPHPLAETSNFITENYIAVLPTLVWILDISITQ